MLLPRFAVRQAAACGVLMKKEDRPAAQIRGRLAFFFGELSQSSVTFDQFCDQKSNIPAGFLVGNFTSS